MQTFVLLTVIVFSNFPLKRKRQFGHSFPLSNKYPLGIFPQSQARFQLNLCRKVLQALTCLQEPCHGHIITVPSCLIFCLNINRWVNISDFLHPSGCREFIWARAGFRIRASRRGSFQALFRKARELFEDNTVHIWSDQLCSKGHPPSNRSTDLKKQRHGSSVPCLFSSVWLVGSTFHFFHSLPDGLGPAREQKSCCLHRPD